jgi:hypothetical protein
MCEAAAAIGPRFLPNSGIDAPTITQMETSFNHNQLASECGIET